MVINYYLLFINYSMVLSLKMIKTCQASAKREAINNSEYRFFATKRLTGSIQYFKIMLKI